MKGGWRVGIGALALAAWTACEPPPEAPVPSAGEVAAYFDASAGVAVEVRGNVATLTVEQDAQHLRRGGSLWAKVGPYVFLFTEETRDLFADHPGLAAVRVTTRVGSAEVASALLTRDELTGVLWRRALNIAGRARLEGTERVTLLEDLVRWGEAHTEHEYNERFVRR